MRSPPAGACGRGGATAVKRGRLLDRMPVLLVGRDRGQQVVLVRPARAAAVVLRLALLHADPGDEDDVVEVLVLGPVQREVLLAGVALLDAARAFEDLLQPPAIGEHHLLLTVGRARQHEVVPELALGERPVEDHELTVKHLGVAPRRALVQSIRTGVTGANAHLRGGDRVVRNEFGEVARVVSL